MMLPPPPELEHKHLERVTFETDVGVVEAFRPAGAPYQCGDPNAPAILLVPGMGMDAVNFLCQLPLGAAGHLHLFENRTVAAAGEQGIAAFARYVEAYIQASKLDQHPGGLILGGASMGGAMSLAVAIRGRIKLRGLVLIGTFGSTRRMRLWRRMLMAAIYFYSPWATRNIAKPILLHSGLFGRFSPREAALLTPTPRFDYRYYVSAMNALRRMNQIEAARRLNIPTLVLHGTRDIVLPIDTGRELAESIPGARLVPVDGGNHMFFLSHHDAVNGAIAEFVGGLRG